jgi:hypothetical protein
MRRSRETRRTSDWVCDEALETAAQYVAGVRSAPRGSHRRALASRSGVSAVVEVLRSVPVEEAGLSAGPRGAELRSWFATGRGLFLSRVPVALLRVPATHAEYLRGRPRQALRTNVNRATAAGIRCALVDDPAELAAAVTAVAARRSQDPATMIDLAVRPGVPRRFTVARDAAGKPVAISETVVDGRWAGLATLVTVPSDEATGLDGQVLRYLLHSETVRDLIGQGVERVVVSGSMFLTAAGTRYFQRRTGYEPVWLRLGTAPAPVPAVPTAPPAQVPSDVVVPRPRASAEDRSAPARV